MSEMNNDERVIPEDPKTFEDWLEDEYEDYDPEGDHSYTDFDNYIFDLLNQGHWELARFELKQRFANEDEFSGWADTPETLADRYNLGPASAGGGYMPNIPGLKARNEAEFVDRFLSGDGVLVAFLGAASLDVLPDNLRPLKEVVDRFETVTDGDGKRFVNQVKHLLQHMPKGIPILGTAISITWTAWEMYKTYQLVENLTQDEFVCMTADFIADNGIAAWKVINGLIDSTLEFMKDPTHKDLVETEDGDFEFTIPAIPVPVRVPVKQGGGTLVADTTPETKTIVWIPGRIDPIADPVPLPEMVPLPQPSWVDTDFSNPFDDLLTELQPEDDIDLEIPNTRVTVDVVPILDTQVDSDNQVIPQEQGDRNTVKTKNGVKFELGLGTRVQTRTEPWKRRRDTKWFGGSTYVKMLWVLNMTWGKASELLDMWNILRKNVYVSQQDLPMNLQQGLRYFLSDGRSQPGLFDYIPIGNLPLSWQGKEFVMEVLEGVVDGSINISVDFEQMFTDMAAEVAMDAYIGKATQAERAAIQKLFGKGNPLDYGNVTTWLDRLGIVDMNEVHTAVAEWAMGLLNILYEQREGNYSQCINPE